MLNTVQVHQQLSERYTGDDQISLELIDGAEPAIDLTMHEFDDMQIELSASGPAGDGDLHKRRLAAAGLLPDSRNGASVLDRFRVVSTQLGDAAPIESPRQ